MISRPIQTQPQGLLGFLQIKNSGKNPENFPDVLQPTLEQFDWYVQTNAQDLPRYQGAFASGVSGYQSFTNPGALIVPNGEWWYVDYYTIRSAVLGAGDGAQFACGMVPQPSLATGLTLKLGEDCVRQSGPATSLAVRAASPFWAPPGAELVLDLGWCSTAATINFIAMVRYTPFPI